MGRVKEPDLIRLIQKLFGDNKRPVLGIGDDCAVIRHRQGFDQLVTTDTVTEGIHFKKEYATPAQLGAKTASVNLSDISAMGAKPLYTLLSINLTPDITEKWIRQFLLGFRKVITQFDCALIGGNVSGAKNDLSFTVTAIGETKKGFAVLRNGAKPGDRIFVTGTPGDSALGYDLLTKNKDRYGKNERKLIKRHLTPTARVEWGVLLGRGKLASAMIDISDGLALDLTRILTGSRVTATINMTGLPLSSEAKKYLTGNDHSVWRRILTGGEDYELLFTIHPRKLKTLENHIRAGSIMAAEIGEITGGMAKPDRLLKVIDPTGAELPLMEKGWSHG